MLRNASRLFLLIVLFHSLAGCAHVVVDPDGTRHITGFMVLTLPPGQQEVAADVIRMRTLGLTVTDGPGIGTQLSLGYSDTTIASMKNDVAISRIALRHAVKLANSKEE